MIIIAWGKRVATHSVLYDPIWHCNIFYYVVLFPLLWESGSHSAMCCVHLTTCCPYIILLRGPDTLICAWESCGSERCGDFLRLQNKLTAKPNLPAENYWHKTSYFCFVWHLAVCKNGMENLFQVCSRSFSPERVKVWELHALSKSSSSSSFFFN